MIWTTEKLNTFFSMKDQGYTLKEIAAELGCTVPAVQSKSHKISTSKKESTKMENSEKKAETVETPTDHIAEAGKKASRADILDRARAIVTGEREKQYGKPEDNFAIIAELWSAYTGREFSSVDVAMMMALLKVARIKTGDYLPDNYVDICGYVACAGEIMAGRPTTCVPTAGDAENGEVGKQSDEINDAQRAE